MSKQTKSFVSLLLIAIIFGGALFYWSKYAAKPQATESQAVAHPQSTIKNDTQANSEKAPTDIANWQEYTDPGSKLSFKYPTDWKVDTYKATDPNVNIIVIDPGNTQDHFRIYIAPDAYFAADGLKKDATKVAGQDAWTVDDMLYGVKTKTGYFTFDLGSDLNLKPTFKALMSTVTFGK